ncbi:hypothetical protein [Deinococcus misasensis]|uniref:hypothetical protein n=1 Tax=Deinococcus misasensis TaxID=392413 RepID=UPI00068AEA7E|nr:hypothetical protein [Deinococcus misasensis]
MTKVTGVRPSFIKEQFGDIAHDAEDNMPEGGIFVKATAFEKHAICHGSPEAPERKTTGNQTGAGFCPIMQP